MTILFESGLTQSDYSKALIAHSGNWLSGGTVSASGTDADYFEAAPANSLTYEKWKPDALSATWEYDHGSAAACDYCAIAAHTMGTNGNSLSVQYHNGSTWADIVSATAITSDAPVLVVFGGETRQRWRIQISGGTAPEIGVVRFGAALEMPHPMYGDHSPLHMARQTKMRSNTSTTGEFLGKSKIRTKLSAPFKWNYLEADWVRANWRPFQIAMEEEAFFVAWRPDKFAEVAYCQTDTPAIPSNMGVLDFMQVELKVSAYAYD